MLEGKPIDKSSKPTLDPIDPNKLRTVRQSSMSKLQSTMKDSRSNFGESNIGGTPGKKQQTGKTSELKMRQTGKSVGKFPIKAATAKKFTGNYADEMSLKTGSVRGNDSDFDLEDFDDIMEKIQLDGAIEAEKQKVNKLRKN